ncbi:MAG: ABC transporter ATP-binding protein [Acidiferrobacteraceae bacterium]|nr:ABC transporter ATP-binding protein [Acidiferrobacteraceae bacterium]
MLEVCGINSFYGGAHILHNVSLKVSAGEVVALLGRNGAGKTTTMKSINGLVRPRSGSITFAGFETTNLPSYRIYRLGLGYVPEERRIFSDLTVLENLEVGRRTAKGDGHAWRVDTLFELFPNLAERRHNSGAQLSGGEQQMLTIARTLMGNPKMILLDEPSEGIAPVIVEKMAETILELKNTGLTVVISEQNLYFAKLLSDRAYVIESGEIRYEGSITDLEADPELREKYLAV